VSSSKRHLLCNAANYLLLLLSEPHRSPEPCSAQKPAEIPIGQPTKLEVVINLRTAKALAPTIPPLMRMRADEMIGVRLMTVIGTFRTSRGARLESAMRTKAEVGQRLQKNGRGQEAELRETRH
jgi:hypothetical protein